MLELVSIMYFAIAGVFLFVSRRRWLLNPSYLWVSLQVLFFAGTILNIDKRIDADRVLVNAMFIGLLSFIYGTLLVDFGWKNSGSEVRAWWSRPLRITQKVHPTIWFLLITSIAISALYYQLIRYNVFLSSIRTYFVSGEGLLPNIATLRLATYGAIGRYFAPGYVNQFKNTLLPMISAFLVVIYIRRKKYTFMKSTALIGLAILNAAFLLGTGQRGALVVAVAIAALFFWVTVPRPANLMLIGSLSVVAATLFLLQTFFLGRTQEVTELSIRGVIEVSETILQRLFRNNQVSGIIGFRYVYDRPIQFGLGWLEGLRELLPSQRQSLSLAKMVFEVRYGSLRGSSPPSIWGSIWYNFGILGIVTIPALLGFAYEQIYRRLFQVDKSVTHLLIFSAYTILLGTWAVSGPDELIGRGLVTVLLLSIIMAFHRRKQSEGLACMESGEVRNAHSMLPERMVTM